MVMRHHFDGVRDEPSDEEHWPLDPQAVDTDAGVAEALGTADGEEAELEHERVPHAWE